MRLSLRGQILIYTLVATLLAVATLAMFTLQRERGREMDESRLESVSKTETFADVIVNEGYLSHPEKLQIIIKSVLSNKRFLSISIYDSLGKIIVQGAETLSTPPLSLAELKQAKDSTAKFNNDQIHILTPMKTSSGEILGYVSVSYTLKKLNEQLSLLFYDMVYALLVCLIFALFASYIFSSRMIKPLRELMDKANRIIQGESVPLTLERQDEIGSLALSLNTMLRYISNRDEKLRLLAASLEAKVELRTRELEAAVKRAEAATEAKATFLASMTHELRTPMNGVIGTASLMADSDLKPAQKEQLAIIRNCGHHLLTVINDILDFSKIEASKMELEFAPLDLKRIISETLDIVKPMTDAKDLVIESKIDKEVPSYIEGDAVRLRQVFVNLISNSIKFTELGGIYIEAHVKQKTAKKTTIEFSVRDTGIGIAQDVQKKLFNAFTQADSSTTRKYGGTGLGLVISKKLIELMGGKICVKSKVGQGSKFTFTIAVKPVDVIPVEMNKESLSKHLAREKPMQILLVEDNLVNQMVAKGFLQKLGYTPDMANNGQEALQALKEKEYNLIFMDMMMPFMDGLEATRIICSLMPAHQRPWIVAMTANALEEHKQQCLAAGMNDFLTKPFTLDNLETAILAAPCVLNPKVVKQCVGEVKVAKNKDQIKTVTPEYQAINKEKIFENFKDDEDLVPFAIEAFMKDYPLRLKEMAHSIKNDNAEQLAMSAHTLRGAVSNFYATSAVDCAYILEKNAKDNNLSTADLEFKNLKAEMKKVHQDLQALLAEIS